MATNYRYRGIEPPYAPWSTLPAGVSAAAIGEWKSNVGYWTQASVADGVTDILYAYDTGGTKDLSFEGTFQITDGTEIETVKVLAHIINSTTNYTSYGIIYSGASSRWDISVTYDASSTSFQFVLENVSGGTITNPQCNWQIQQVEVI